MRRIGFLLMLICIGDVVEVRGGEKDQPAPSADQARDHEKDREAIRALNQAFIRDFNRGDARAIASKFTEDARIIDEQGRVAEGRAAIEARFAEGFANEPGITLELTTDAIRFLNAETAIEEGSATLRPASGSGEVETSRYTVIYVKRDGQWLQADIRDQAMPASQSSHEHLKQLAWMLGDWLSEGGDVVVRSSCQWAEKKNFLLRSFSVEMEGRPILAGNERIAWDPSTRRFRSWVFDSDGGFAEGTWYRAGDGQWIQKARGVRSDGEIASATRYVMIESPDRFFWKIVDRTIGGQALPGEMFVMVRQPPRPSVSPGHEPE